MQDLINLFFLISLLILSGAIAEQLARKKYFAVSFLQNFFFFTLSVFFAIAFFVLTATLYKLLFGLLIFVVFFAIRQNSKFVLLEENNGKVKYLFLALAFLIELSVFEKLNFFAPFSFLLAGFLFLIVSSVNFKNGKVVKIGTEEKKFAELLFLFSLLFLLLLVGFKLNLFKSISSFPYQVYSAFLISVVLTLFYSVSSGGGEYLNLPVSLAILLFVFVRSQNYDLLMDFSVGFLLAGIVAFLSYKVKFLTLSGSVATFLLAGFIFGLGGWKWSIPILAFFVLSSLLSKVRKKKNTDVDFYFEKTGVRDHWQVIANGGLSGVLILLNQLYPNDLFYIAYLASLAAVCADTWATEIGTMFPAKTYNILTFEEIAQGISGGVSLRGTLGGFAGAFVIALSGMFWVDASFSYFALIVSAGLLGSVVDSLLGATVQLQNRCVVCNKITERQVHCSHRTEYFRGWHWLNNDIVNLAAGFFGIFVITVFYVL